MKNRFVVRILCLFLIIINFEAVCQAQSPTYQLRIANESQPTPNTYEFEVFLLNTSASVFELQFMQFGLGWDTTILNGGTQTYSIVTVIDGNPLLPAPSEFNTSQVPTMVPSGPTVSTAGAYPGLKFRYFNCAPKAAPGPGNGTIISTVDGGCSHPGTRMARFRLTNTVPFTSSSTCKHIWSTTTGSFRTSTIVQAYVFGTAVNITNTQSNLNYNYSGACNIQPNGIVLNSPDNYCSSQPTANAGGPYFICSDAIKLNGSIGGSATFGTWSSTTGGTFIPDANTLNAIYTPSPDDVINGSIVLTLTTDNPLGGICSAAVSNVNALFINIDDGNSCTIDICNSLTASFSHLPIQDDGDACTIDACNSLDGIISHLPIAGINDNNVCTIDACNSSTGFISHTLIPEVSDNNSCTLDICNSITGSVSHFQSFTLLATDTSICQGDTVTLSMESLPGIPYQICSVIDLSVNLRNGLVAFYPFCGNANDESGNGNNGTVSNATLTADRFGIPNRAYAFNGTNSLINVSNNFINNGWPDYTISMWFNTSTNSNPTGVSQALMNTSPHNGFALTYNNTNNRRIGHFKNSNPSLSTWDIIADNFNYNPVNLNTWIHVSIVKTGLTYTYYVNGLPDKVVTTSITPISYLCSLRIGGISCCDLELFKGSIDDIAIYNRSLSGSEIYQLYNSNSSVSYLWSNGSSLPQIKVAPSTSSVFYCTTSWNGNNCTDSVSININTVISSANAGGPYVTCAGAIQLQGSIGGLAVSGTWSSPTGGTFSPSASMLNAIYTPSAADLTNGSVTLTLIANNPNGALCPTVTNNATVTFIPISDGNACTLDGCNSLTGSISHSPLSSIDDSNLCTTDICNTANGSITHPPIPTINDNNACTTDACNSVNANITHTIIPNIDDGNICTTDACNTISGSISHSLLAGINDNNACTIDACNSISGIISHVAIPGIDDNDFCTIDVCNSLNGSITHSLLAGINDNNVCTIDACNSTSGIISHVANTGIDDNDFCTIDECNSVNGTITHTTLPGVDDGNACTADVCNSVTGTISHESNIVSNPSLVCPGENTFLSIKNITGLAPSVCTSNDLPLNLRSGLVAFYPFCGNANDASGNGNNGTVSNATLTTDRFGNASKAYNFNGTNAYINISNTFFNNGWNNSTISMWFNTSSNTNSTGVAQTLLNTTPHNGFALNYNYNNNRKVAFVKNSNPALANWDILFVDNFNYNPINLNTWIHVAIVKTGLTYTYYINGILDKVVTTSINPISYMCSLRIGGITCCDSELFKGKLDDIAIYDRSLSSLEIQQLSSSETYAWSNGSTSASITVAPIQTTNYSCTINHNGVICTQSVLVNVSPTYNIHLNDTFCQGSNYVLPWGIIVSNAGNFSHTYLSVIGCDSTINMHLAIRSLPNATISFSGSTFLCNGQSLTLSAPNSMTYLWSNGSVNQNITVNTTGNYSVTVTDAYSCSSSSSIISVTADTCPVALKVRFFIDGFYLSNGQMIASIDPVNLPFVSDIVVVELHDPNSPYSIFKSVQGIFGTDGWGNYVFPSQTFGNSYYITLKHRNSIETWSKNPVQIFNLTSYDFTISSTQAFSDDYGNLPMKLIDTNPDRWAIYSGDIDQDGAVTSLDMSLEENDTNIGAYGYIRTDVNGDGASESLDMTIIENNILIGAFVIRP